MRTVTKAINWENEMHDTIGMCNNFMDFINIFVTFNRNLINIKCNKNQILNEIVL